MRLAISPAGRLPAGVLAALLVLAVGASGPVPADVVVQGEGVAAARDATVRGDIVFGVPAREVHALLEEQMRFRADQLASIERIGDSLDLGECALVSFVRRIEADPDAASALVELANRHDAVAEAAAALDSRDPAQAQTRRAALEANRQGDLERAESLLRGVGKGGILVSVGRGIAAGRDVNITGDVLFGVPRPAFEALLDDMRRQESAQFDRLQRLSEDLSVNRCATASFLRILGENQVPTEQIHAKLKEIASRHLELVAQLRAMTTQDPEIEALRKQAATAIDAGDHDAADGLLQQAQRILAEKSEQPSPLMRDYARVEADLGRLRLTRLRYAEAAEWFQRAAKHAFSAGSPSEEARYLELAGGAFQDAGLYTQAFGALTDALGWRQSSPDQGSQTATIVALNNLGGLHLSQSDYGGAVRRFEQAMDVAASVVGADPQELALLEAASHSGLADARVSLNDFELADEHYALALSLLEFVHGADDPRLVPVMTNWAWLRTNRGDYACAEGLYRRAIGIVDAGRGARDLESAVTLNNLAVLYYNTGRYDEAEGLWNQVMEIYRSELGEDHFVTLGVSQNLAKILRRKGNLDGAEKLYLHALDVWERSAERGEVPDDHLVIASLLASLGDLYVSQGRLDEAEEMYEEAIHRARSQLGFRSSKGHLLIAGFRNDLAVLYEKQERYDEAAAALGEVRGIMGSKLGLEHPNYGTATSNLARVMARLGRPDEAVPLYLEAIAVAERTGRPLLVALRSRHLAAAYRDQGRVDEARDALERALEIYRENLESDNAKIGALERELADLPGGGAP